MRPRGPARARARDRRGAARAGRRCRALVALGGGRVIDTAKAIAAVAGRPGRGDPDDALGRRDDRRSTAFPRGAGAAPGPARAGHRRPAAMTSQPEARAARQRDERARARRRLPLHAVREPGLADDGARRRQADRDRARPATRPSATAPPSRSARSSAATRSTRRCFAPPPRRLPDPGPRLRHPARRDQRGDPAAGDEALRDRAPAGRSPRWRRRSAPSAAGSAPGSRSSAAAAGAWASSAPTNRARRGARRDARPRRAALTPDPPDRDELRAAHRSRLVGGDRHGLRTLCGPAKLGRSRRSRRVAARTAEPTQ